MDAVRQADVLGQPIEVVRNDGRPAIVRPSHPRERDSSGPGAGNWAEKPFSRPGLPTQPCQPADRRDLIVNPRFPSTLTAPLLPPSKSPGSRRWPVANSYAVPKVAFGGSGRSSQTSSYVVVGRNHAGE
jgi:hypothetical protein